jgi:hypothetical protein
MAASKLVESVGGSAAIDFGSLWQARAHGTKKRTRQGFTIFKNTLPASE